MLKVNLNQKRKPVWPIKRELYSPREKWFGEQPKSLPLAQSL